MKNPFAKAVLVVVPLLPFVDAANAIETVLNCPAEIPENSIQIQTPSPEWQGFVDLPLRLHGAVFMSGESSTRTHLKPDSSNEAKGISTWKFEGDYPEGKWLSCFYANGFISLSQKIDDRFSECSLIYRKDAKDKKGQWILGGVEKISCK